MLSAGPSHWGGRASWWPKLFSRTWKASGPVRYPPHCAYLCRTLRALTCGAPPLLAAGQAQQTAEQRAAAQAGRLAPGAGILLAVALPVDIAAAEPVPAAAVEDEEDHLVAQVVEVGLRAGGAHEQRAHRLLEGRREAAMGGGVPAQPAHAVGDAADKLAGAAPGDAAPRRAPAERHRAEVRQARADLQRRLAAALRGALRCVQPAPPAVVVVHDGLVAVQRGVHVERRGLPRLDAHRRGPL
mmetsp:Transcript_4120/g.10569  ORF Transcript_4120/g.10569 Transcript_4120/m.10569 type:complete len:242 (+) Transcript_4120:128-853(+)